MIKVRIHKKEEIIERIDCKGHAGYAEYGKDIVCAAFSTMIITIVNAILGLNSNSIDIITEDNA